MKYSDFEKHIEKKLAHAEESVDMDLLLDQLNIIDRQKRKSKPFFIWLLIPILAVGSVLAFMAMNDNQSTTDDQSTDGYSSTTYKVDKKRAIETKPVAEVYTSESDEYIRMSSHSTSISSDSKLMDVESESPQIDPSKDAIASNVAEPNKIATSMNIVNPQTSNINDQYTLRDGSSKIIKFQDDINIDIENRSNTANIEPFAINENTSLKNKPNLKNTGDTNNEISKRSTIEWPIELSNRSISIDGLSENEEKLFTRMKINCPSFNQAYWRLALIPEVGVFAPFKTLENKLTEDTPEFVARNTQETTLEGLNIGLYTMLVRDRLPVYLKAGISYSRITERMNLEYNYTVLDTTVGVISETVSANGDTITQIYGDVITEINRTGKNRQHSYIHLFDVPISVGYNTYVGGFDVGIEGGVRVNLMTRATGTLLISETEFTSLSLDRRFQPRIGLSYFGGLLIGRNFGRFGDFYLAPRFTYFPDDFSNEVNNISQKYVSAGINFGVVFNIK